MYVCMYVCMYAYMYTSGPTCGLLCDDFSQELQAAISAVQTDDDRVGPVQQLVVHRVLNLLQVYVYVYVHVSMQT